MVVRLSFILALIYSHFSFSAHAKVEISVNNTAYSYSANPRLAEILAPMSLADDWYWPQSKLFRTNTGKSQALRSEIIEILFQQKQNDGKHGLVYNDMSDQIIMWDIADFVPLTIDFDLARVSAEHNPLVENGQYRIFLSKRASSVYVFGALEKDVNLPYKNDTCIEAFSAEVAYSDLADKSHIYVISAQGQITKKPIAYWNTQCTLLMPGAMIYIPLRESLFSPQHRIINSKMAELAVNRITIQ
ncbi:hypothetical protein BAE46_07390 [Glaciecola punicea]|uniref:capsule biosynthesis GfcC family protein n=1 Tax=Glaciecola punicea TaxID=56804 RepID=UPI00087309CC|nr:capsule biosynthesis GfcC family protein [Glaciecola punicea]OFA32054.1 hypothetical protein BAE46_07390 [Glaciecola punicea]